jgi:NADH dehydrogenase
MHPQANQGIMAYIGKWNAIVQLNKGSLNGRAAWLMWRGAYLVKSISWRNRLLIPMYWTLNALFGRDISRF